MVKRIHLFLIFLLTVPGRAADDYSAWIYYKTISLNTKASGAGVTGNVIKFPVLVRLGAADSLIFKNSRKNGQDVRFSKANDVHLAYQIERWDSAGRAAELWVLADTVKAGDSTQYVKMYWGNKNAADSSRPTAVFDVANGFLGVYHLSGGVSDARGDYNGTDSGTTDTGAGLIGRGRSFSGASKSFFWVDGFPQRDSGSISCWFKSKAKFDASSSYNMGLWANKIDNFNNAVVTFRGQAGTYDVPGGGPTYGAPGCIQTKMEAGSSSSSSSTYLGTTTASFDSVSWYHVAWTWGYNNESIYLNGKKEKDTNSCQTVLASGADEIGQAHYDTANIHGDIIYRFSGIMDEFRMEKTVRSADWIKLCLKNQKLTAGADSLTRPGAIQVMPPDSLSYALRAPYYPSGTAITANVATVVRPSGAIIDSFTVSPSLPAGLSIVKATGTISGTPSAAGAVKCTVTVWNASGSAKCPLSVTVYTRPSITTQPVNLTVNAGATASFSVTASGTSPLSYQWWRGATQISGATAATYSFTSGASDNNATFKCVVRYNSTVDSAWSNSCTLRVIVGPAITTQPAKDTVPRGGTASFSVAASGTAPLTYLWIKNAADTVSGATSATLSIAAVQRADDVTRYRCVVKNSAGSATSNPCTLRVVAAAFGGTPRSGTGSLTVQFTDSSSGGVSAWTWDFGDGSAGSNAVNPPHSYTAAGMYPVQLKVSAGSVVDSIRIADYISVAVYNRPSITQQPVSVTTGPGGTATFTVAVSGSTPLSFQWWSGASPVSGATLATYSITNVGAANDGAVLKCVVKYAPTGDSAVSGLCTLHVLAAPLVTAQPLPATVRRGSPVSFAVTASGTPPLTYIWIKNATDTVSQGAAATLPIAAAQRADDLSRYRCVVKNAAGSATSLPCTLRVVAAGFSAAPRSGTDSLTVQFSDSSTGGVAAWTWDFGDGSVAGAGAAPSHRYDSAGLYSVLLRVNAVGIVDSVRIVDCISVRHAKPVAAFGADTFFATDSLTVRFTDASSGVVTGRRWIFGDGGFDTSMAKTVTHRYGDTGAFTVKLVITGPGGIDSVTRLNFIKIRSKGEYPVIVTGRRISADSVEVRFYDYSSIVTSQKTPIPPWADSMGLWFKRGVIPTSPGDSIIAGYSIIAMQQSGREPFVDTVRVPFASPADSVFYGFNTAAFWVNQPSTVMKSSAGALVFMRDTVRPVNLLTVSGAYRGIDTFALFLDAVSALDTHSIDSVGIWYGFKKPPDFTDAQHTRWFAVSRVIAEASQNRFTLILRDGRLNGDTARLYCAATVAGKNRLKSAVKDTSFMAGRLRPVNPIRLLAAAQSPTSIQLSWREKGSGRAVTAADSIIIWRGVKPLPKTHSPPSSDFTALRPAEGDTALLCRGLNEKTRYYFGGQILSQGLWSSITDSACATDSTPGIVSAQKAVNTVTMRSLTFDEGGGRIVTCWRIDSLDSGMEVGIAYSTMSYPRDSLFPPSQIVKAASAEDSAAVDVGKLEWDSAYYVSLWLRKNEGKWALPTEKSQMSLRLPKEMTWQIIKYFMSYPDTVTAFDGKLLLAAGSEGAAVPTTDTIRSWDAAPVASKGFVAVSRGFLFAQHPASAPFYIGVRYDAALIPSAYSARDVRLYFQKGGELFLQKTAFLDTAGAMVWSLASDVSAPFVALVDTVAPVVEVVSRAEESAASGRDLMDTFLIRDNIANPEFRYRFAKGDGEGAAADSGEARGSPAVVTGAISRSYVNEETGVRAVFSASDGPHTVAVDVSRQVSRDSSFDVTSVLAGRWCPLRTTSLLDSPSVRRALKDLYVKGEWYYDNTAFRLFRWYASSDNAADSVKWIEYSDSTDRLFNLDPCRLIWIKTRKNVVLHLGKGKTTSLKTSYTVAAAPRTWTDIALPFGFSIRIGDVIDSTNGASGGGKGDSLQFYSWKVDSATGQYRCRPLFMGDFVATEPSLADKSDSLFKGDGGFSVYNPLPTAVTVAIPPIPAGLSDRGRVNATRGKQTRGGGWAVRVAGRTEGGTQLGDVYCGFGEGAPGIAYYPAPHSFSGIGIGVCDSLRRPHGHGLARGRWNRENGVLFPLIFSNGTESAETIVYTVENLAKIPKNARAFAYDCATGKFEDASGQLTVRVAGKTACYRHLAIGTEAYLKKVRLAMQEWRLALVAAFSSPGSHALKIRFTLPYAGVSGVAFTMVDLMGRTVWTGTVACGGASGPREYVWRDAPSGRRSAGPGIYIVRMVARDEKKSVVGAFQAKVSLLP